MGAERLTTLTAVKEWLGISTDDSDAGLQRMIDAVSRFILNYLSRPTLLRSTYSWNFMGNGKSSLLLPNWPVLGITSVGVGSMNIPPVAYTGANMSSGYYLSPERPGYRELLLNGYDFRGGVEIVYEAGFEASETDTIPATPFQLTPTTGGAWSTNVGVTIDGVAATEVASGPPTAGQYVVDEGVYTFAAADANKTAVMTYSYVPYDIAFAATEMVGEWYKRKDRIGVLSKTLGGQETVVFNNQDMSSPSRSALQPYRNII